MWYKSYRLIIIFLVSTDTKMFPIRNIYRTKKPNYPLMTNLTTMSNKEIMPTLRSTMVPKMIPIQHRYEFTKVNELPVQHCRLNHISLNMILKEILKNQINLVKVKSDDNTDRGTSKSLAQKNFDLAAKVLQHSLIVMVGFIVKFNQSIQISHCFQKFTNLQIVVRVICLRVACNLWGLLSQSCDVNCRLVR